MWFKLIEVCSIMGQVMVTEASPVLRVKTKMILERIVRKFGYDKVLGFCPEADKKLIVNIKKTKDREKRKKASGRDQDQSATGAGADAMEVKPARSGIKASYVPPCWGLPPVARPFPLERFCIYNQGPAHNHGPADSLCVGYTGKDGKGMVHL